MLRCYDRRKSRTLATTSFWCCWMRSEAGTSLAVKTLLRRGFCLCLITTKQVELHHASCPMEVRRAIRSAIFLAGNGAKMKCTQSLFSVTSVCSKKSNDQIHSEAKLVSDSGPRPVAVMIGHGDFVN